MYHRKDFILGLAATTLFSPRIEASFSPTAIKPIEPPKALQGSIICSGRDLANLTTVRAKVPEHLTSKPDILIPFGAELIISKPNDTIAMIFAERFRQRLISQCQEINEINPPGIDADITTHPCFSRRELGDLKKLRPAEYWDKFSVVMPWEIHLETQREDLKVSIFNLINPSKRFKSWNTNELLDNAECAAVQFHIYAEDFRRELYALSTHRDKTLTFRYPARFFPK